MLQKINAHLENFKRPDIVVKRWEESEMSQGSKEVYWRYKPMTESYFSELNASFVLEYAGMMSISTYPFITLRDGYLGILFFFLRNPKPPMFFSTQILVPAKFEKLIPKTWKENVLVYEMIYEKTEDTKKGLFYGLPAKENFAVDTAKEKLKRAFSKNMEIHSLVSPRDRLFNNNENEQIYYHDFTKELYKKYGFDVTIHSEFRPMEWSSTISQYGLFNLDSDNFFVYSDYLTFFFCSRGATYLNKPKELIREEDVLKEIKLSMYHSMRIKEVGEFSNYFASLLIKAKMNSIPVVFHDMKFYRFALEEFKAFCKND